MICEPSRLTRLRICVQAHCKAGVTIHQLLNPARLDPKYQTLGDAIIVETVKIAVNPTREEPTLFEVYPEDESTDADEEWRVLNEVYESPENGHKLNKESFVQHFKQC